MSHLSYRTDLPTFGFLRDVGILRMHTKYVLGQGYNPVHYITCTGIRCEECFNKDLYTVCPGCGGKLKSCSGECDCGTAIIICHNNNRNPIVTKYAIPNKMFLPEEEDTI